MSYIHSNTDQVGRGVETTHGVAVAATKWIPAAGFTQKVALNKEADKGLRGSVVDTYGHTVVQKNVEFTITEKATPELIWHAFAATLGHTSRTEDDAYVRTLQSNNVPSYTIYVISDEGSGTRVCNRYIGCRATSVRLSWGADRVAEIETSYIGLDVEAVAVPTPAYDESDAKIPGATISTCVVRSATGLPLYVRSGQLTLGRDGTAADFVAAGSITALAVVGGALTVGLTLNILHRAAELAAYEDDTTFGIDIQFGANTRLHISQARYTSATPDRSERFHTLELEVSPEGNVADQTAEGFTFFGVGGASHVITGDAPALAGYSPCVLVCDPAAAPAYPAED